MIHDFLVPTLDSVREYCRLLAIMQNQHEVRNSKCEMPYRLTALKELSYEDKCPQRRARYISYTYVISA
jgi:hypothetical protein